MENDFENTYERNFDHVAFFPRGLMPAASITFGCKSIRQSAKDPRFSKVTTSPFQVG
jgi:hypothetical protein